MAAARNIFLPINGKNEIEIHESHIYNAIAQLQRYSGLKGSDFYRKASEPGSDWLKRLIKNFLLDDSSREIRYLFTSVFGQLEMERTIFVFELVLEYENEFDDNYSKQPSLTKKGTVESGGLYGLLHGAIEFTLTQSNRLMPRTAGSGNGGAARYSVMVRRLREPMIAARDLVPDQRLPLTNGGWITLLTPTSNKFIYCVPKVLEHILTVQHREKNIHLLKDESIPVPCMIKIIEKLQLDKKMMKRVVVKKMYKNKSRYYLKTIFGNDKVKKDETWTTIIVNVKEDHVWILETLNKRERVHEAETCGLCGREISNFQMNRHLKNCNHKKSLESINLKARDLHYHVPEYTPQMLEEEKANNNTSCHYVMRELLNGNSTVTNCIAGCGKTTRNLSIIREMNLPTFVVGPTGNSVSPYGKLGYTWHMKFKWNALKKGTTIEKLLMNPLYFKSRIEEVFKRNPKVWKEWENKPAYFIIEECSMIKGIEIKFMSFILQTLYDSEEYFGGIPVIICGDAGQMAPIDEENQFYDPFFQCIEIASILHSSGSVNLNYPYRLSMGVSDPFELCDQLNILNKIRLGQLDDRLFTYLNKMDCNEFKEMCKNGEFEKKNGIVIASTSTALYKVYEAIVRNNNGYVKVGRFKIGTLKDSPKSDLYLKIGQRILVTDSWVVPSKYVVNGTPATVVKIEPEKWIKIEIDNGKQFKIKPHNGYMAYHNKGLFMVQPEYLRSFPKAQGDTWHDRPVFFYCQDYDVPLYYKYGSGDIYTALTRPTNLRNITIVCKPETTLRECIKPQYVWCYENVCKVIKNPKSFIPIDVVMGSKGELKLRDTRSITGYVDVTDTRILNRAGHHKDRDCMVAEQIFSNKIVYDIETSSRDECNNGIDILRCISIALIYYDVYGNVSDFKTIIERNGESIEELGDYHIRSDGVIIFSIWDYDNPMFQFAMILRKMMYMVCKLIDFRNNEDKSKKNRSKYQYPEIEKMLYNPLKIIGYNNLGFDDRPLIKEIIMNHDAQYKLEEAIIQAGGSNLKGMSIKYENRLLLGSFDIIQHGAPMSLDKVVKTYIAPIINQSDMFRNMHSRLGKYGIDPDENKLCENWDEKSITEKKNVLSKFLSHHLKSRHYQGLNTKHKIKKQEEDESLKGLHALIQRCFTAARRDDKILSNLHELGKKGTCPLKLTRGKTNDEIRALGIVDLLDIMDDGNGSLNWSVAFYDRDVPKGKELLKEYGEEFMRNYDFKKELLEYNAIDTKLTDLYVRLKDKSNYRFCKEMEEFQFKDSWGGLGTSILDYCTMTSSTMSIFYATLPDDIRYDGGNNMRIYTKFPRMSPQGIERVKCENGGKTLGRNPHRKYNDWRKDGGCYLDAAAMYNHTQVLSQYPYELETFLVE